MSLDQTHVKIKANQNKTIFCNVCRYEYTTALANVCPKCGYPYLEFTTNIQKWKQDIQAYREKKGLHLVDLKVGQVHKMGVYQNEEMTWRVLAVRDQAALLISEKGLDTKAFHDESDGSSWDNSDLRKWLNTVFGANSFKKEEVECIYTSFVNPETNPEYPTNQGQTVKDVFFLLSIDEAKAYFSDNEEREAEPTLYAKTQGAYTNDRGKCCWWLRSLGCKKGITSYVRTDGRIITEGSDCNDVDICIRPAMWVNLFWFPVDEEVLQADSVDNQEVQNKIDKNLVNEDSYSEQLKKVYDASVDAKAAKNRFIDEVKVLVSEKYYKKIMFGLIGVIWITGFAIVAMRMPLQFDHSMNQAALVQDEDMYPKNDMTSYRIGQVITFGSYEQDNKDSNGMEPIKWRVVDRKGEDFLLVSIEGLDAKPYHESDVSITWENSSLRKWLNDSFYKIAFSDSEKQKIQTTQVAADKNPYFETSSKTITEDKVFILSMQELERYFPDEDERMKKPTEYAVSNGVYQNKNITNCWWWVRTPGSFMNRSVVVNTEGVIDQEGIEVDFDNGCICPAIWVKL